MTITSIMKESVHNKRRYNLYLLHRINIIIYKLASINNVSVLPPLAAVILVIISVALTMFAGLIPSSMASKKDPVVSLRTE